MKSSSVIYIFIWAAFYGNRDIKVGRHFWREIFPCANASSFVLKKTTTKNNKKQQKKTTTATTGVSYLDNLNYKCTNFIDLTPLTEIYQFREKLQPPPPPHPCPSTPFKLQTVQTVEFLHCLYFYCYNIPMTV